MSLEKAVSPKSTEEQKVLSRGRQTRNASWDLNFKFTGRQRIEHVGGSNCCSQIKCTKSEGGLSE